ncbi:Glycoside hydrolase family 76 protein [Mycena venus]|uniref:Glycoside hydrolase family 76 protein n=1 Tax=Mycena venus TaxID=2733690 RepID=A0A8H7CG16_9AGAR|nr:Glycoside hydrolase family 76 protein [Mycena venus]
MSTALRRQHQIDDCFAPAHCIVWKLWHDSFPFTGPPRSSFEMVPVRTPICFLLFLGRQVAAQLSFPFWRDPNMTMSKLGAIPQFAGSGYLDDGNFYGVVAEYDIATNGTQYQDALKEFFPQALGFVFAYTSDSNIEKRSANAQVQDGLVYGYAAARAYAAYKDPIFLQYAIDSWSFASTFTLTEADTGAGQIPVKNFTIQGLCQGQTMAGGTFTSTDAENTEIDSTTTGLYAVLSGLLAEATSQPMYRQAAQQSINFLQTHLYNSQNLVEESITSGGSKNCTVQSSLVVWYTGFMIEAVAILASITDSENPATQALLDQTIQAAISSTIWLGVDGIFLGAGDLELPRAIAAAHNRNVTTLRDDARAFLTNQFNAVVNFATINGSNIYGSDWHGPPGTNLSAAPQTPALAVIVAAIQLGNVTDGSGSATSALPSATASSIPATDKKKASPAGAIAGGVIGGVVLLLGGVALLLFLRRRWYTGNARTMHPADLAPFVEVAGGAPLAASAGVVLMHNDKATLNGTQSADTTGSAPSRLDAKRHNYPAPSIQGSLSAAETGEGALPAAPETLPMQDLVRLLYERLQPQQQWTEEEAPPTYYPLS